MAHSLGILNGKEILGVAPNTLSAPIAVLLEMTRKCNLRCLHCFSNSGDVTTKELSTSQWKEIIDQLVEMKVFLLFISGGEPLIRPDFFELTKYIIDNGFDACLLTNATLITPQAARKIRKIGLYKVEANLDGPCADVYDEFRGVKGSFEATIKGIKALKAAGFPVRINVVVNKLNYDKIPKILDVAVELGANDVALLRLSPGGRALQNWDKIVLTDEEYDELSPLFKSLREAYSRKLLLAWEGDTVLGSLVDPFGLHPACGAGRFHFTITPTGAVKPCPSWDDDDPFAIAGNCSTERLIDIWKDSKLFKLLQTADIPLCRDCEKRGCMGGCRLRAYQKYGGLPGGPDPRCKRLKQSSEISN
jgi:radical SAM protein with 4Fe4S-binding SPASM domain